MCERLFYQRPTDFLILETLDLDSPNFLAEFPMVKSRLDIDNWPAASNLLLVYISSLGLQIVSYKVFPVTFIQCFETPNEKLTQTVIGGSDLQIWRS